MNEYKSRMYLFSRAREHGEDADADRTNSHRWRPRIIQNIYKGYKWSDSPLEWPMKSMKHRISKRFSHLVYLAKTDHMILNRYI